MLLKHPLKIRKTYVFYFAHVCRSDRKRREATAIRC